jgi:hypothetical protein
LGDWPQIHRWLYPAGTVGTNACGDGRKHHSAGILALKTLPIGTAYAVWTGIGAVGTALLGIILFDEPATAARLASIGMIVSGIVGLKLVT